MDPFEKMNPDDAVEQKAGAAVRKFSGGTDEANGSDGGNAGGEFGRGFFAQEVGHTKEVVCFERVVEHGAITRFEDIEGEGTVREEGTGGQDDDSCRFWDL